MTLIMAEDHLLQREFLPAWESMAEMRDLFGMKLIENAATVVLVAYRHHNFLKSF